MRKQAAWTRNLTVTCCGLQIGNPSARANGLDVTLGAPPVLVNGRTMVPLRFVAEALHHSVTWVEAARLIEIEPIKP
ncbi:copper amine oxidase N-terminal domain-containing protein [Paenibacillus sp. P25]|nr:copper amine oxidase N-terminal domain-containing protein [Paenibacillus sp. P25]